MENAIDDKDLPPPSDDDVQWFIDQLRVMFPDAQDLVSVWQDLLSKDARSVLRQIVDRP